MTHFWLLSVMLGQAGLTLQWHAPPGCPAEASLRARVEHLSGNVDATVRNEVDGWHLVVQVNGALRQLTAATCDEAGEAVVLLTQLALSASADPAPKPAPAQPPVAPTTPWSFHAALIGDSRLGWLPTPMFRAGGALAVTRGPLRMGVDVTTALEQRFLVDSPTPDAAVLAHVALEGQVSACWLLGERLSVGPCAVFALATLSTRGLHVSAPRSATQPIWSGGASALASLKLLGWLELLLGGGVRFGPEYPLFFEGFQPSVTAGPVAFDLLLAVGGFL